jgi:hypothetical protein
MQHFAPALTQTKKHGNNTNMEGKLVACKRTREEIVPRLTFGSMIFRYRTWIPLVVKYGISNFTLMGRFPFAV